MATVTLSVKKKHIRQHKINTRAPDDILRSYEVKQSVCERNWTSFITLLAVIQSLRHTVRSDVRFTSESFFWTGSFSELMNQFIKSDWSVWNSLQLEQHRSTSYSIKTHFQTPDSHSDSKWAKTAVNLILWWMNWFRDPVYSLNTLKTC